MTSQEIAQVQLEHAQRTATMKAEGDFEFTKSELAVTFGLNQKQLEKLKELLAIYARIGAYGAVKELQVNGKVR